MSEITRRGFIAKIGQGVAGVSVASGLVRQAAAGQQLAVLDPPGNCWPGQPFDSSNSAGI